MSGFIPFAEVVADVERLCRQRRSGKVFVTTADNRAITFGLDDGRIVALQYRIRRGERALASMTGMGPARWSFSEGADLSPDDDLPTTSEILARLGFVPRADGGSSTSADSSSGGAPAAAPGALSERFRRVVEETLAEIIGPMANLIAPKAFAVAADEGEALRKLVERISDPERSRRFDAEVRRRLGLD